MAEGRMLRRSIATNEQLAGVSLEAAFVFTWCIPFLDVEGRMYGSPVRVKALVFPAREEITPAVIEHALGELHGAGLVVWYEAGGVRCLAFPGFLRNNSVRPEKEGKSKVPPPPDQVAAPTQRPDDVRTNPGARPEPAGSNPGEVKGEEVRRTEPNIPARGLTHERAAIQTPQFNYAPFVDAYRERFGVDPDKKDARVLKELVAQHGNGEVLARYARFLVAKGQYGIHVFRRTWADWEDAGPRARTAAERFYDILTTQGLLSASKEVFTAEVERLYQSGKLRDRDTFMHRVGLVDLQHLSRLQSREAAVAYIGGRFAATADRRAAS